MFDDRIGLRGERGTADTFDWMPAPLPDMDAARIAARERRAGLLAGAALAVVAVVVMAFALHTLAAAPVGATRAAAPVVTPAAPAPPAATPLAGSVDTPAPVRGTSRAATTPAPLANDLDRIPMTDASAKLFLPLYRRAARAFGVNWRLIASIHQQETSFSSAPGTYRGLNFARCCAGPMQFNVTNGPVTTWARFRDSYRRAERPATYPHRTRKHPSVYDDFDAIMAAGALLASNGAGRHLDGSAWLASYHYYGHDFTGLQYADNVLARAVGWSRNGLCVPCAVDAGLAAHFDASFAAPFRAELVAAERRARAAAKAKERAKRAARADRRRAARLAAERKARARKEAAKNAAKASQRKAAAQSHKATSAAAEVSAAAAGSGGEGLEAPSFLGGPPPARSGGSPRWPPGEPPARRRESGAPDAGEPHRRRARPAAVCSPCRTPPRKERLHCLPRTSPRAPDAGARSTERRPSSDGSRSSSPPS